VVGYWQYGSIAIWNFDFCHSIEFIGGVFGSTPGITLSTCQKVTNTCMKMGIIDIKQEPYFPFTFRLLGIILIVTSPLIYISQPHYIAMYLLMILLPIVGFILLTSRYGLLIDTQEKSYTIYTWILGRKFGNPKSFRNIEKFYVNEVTDSMVMTTRAGIQHDIKKRTHKAFMKLDNGDKIHVDTDSNYDKLNQRVEDYRALCNELLKSI
jgi:hypothetical protein